MSDWEKTGPGRYRLKQEALDRIGGALSPFRITARGLDDKAPDLILHMSEGAIAPGISIKGKEQADAAIRDALGGRIPACCERAKDES